jgi:hypothetical protein
VRRFAVDSARFDKYHAGDQTVRPGGSAPSGHPAGLLGAVRLWVPHLRGRRSRIALLKGLLVFPIDQDLSDSVQRVSCFSGQMTIHF